jgi:hypothetical protein
MKWAQNEISRKWNEQKLEKKIEWVQNRITFLFKFFVWPFWQAQFMVANYSNTGCRVFTRRVQIKNNFCLKINTPNGNYWILRIGVVGRCQKVPKFKFQSQLESFSIFFSLKNITWEAHFFIKGFFKLLYFAQYLTARHYTNLQNSIISFGLLIFWAKLFLILYPSLEKSTTHITILQSNCEL